jgi:hypothetical protein
MPESGERGATRLRAANKWIEVPIATFNARQMSGLRVVVWPIWVDTSNSNAGSE